MLQVLQNQKSGKIEVVDLPAPSLREGGVIVQTQASLVSAGTERTSVQTAKASLLTKARMRPDLVQQVIRSAKREGMMATYKKVRARLSGYKELGYSASGYVLESSIPDIRKGERVACGGAGYAVHSEVIFVPRHLLVPLPDAVSYEQGAFATVGAIALHGVRQADVKIGETVAVIGLGLIGLLTVQILKSAGCNVVGIDIRDATFPLAKKLGCDACYRMGGKVAEKIQNATMGIGTDAVIITAGTASNEPVELALDIARKRSTVTVVGAVKMDIPRPPFYEKEIELRIASSYGPGRYDPAYEEKGIDYPVGYVRWTENRNMGAFVRLLDTGRIVVDPLISHRFPIEKASNAYATLTSKRTSSLGIVLQYPEIKSADTVRLKLAARKGTVGGKLAAVPLAIGFVGAGKFAQSYLLPTLTKKGVTLHTVVNQSPVSSKAVSERYGFLRFGTDTADVLKNPDIDTVFVATRHDSHAAFVLQALRNGKNVFVEKPLAVTIEDVKKIAKAWKDPSSQSRHLMVGYNRRFSSPIIRMKEFLRESNEPLVLLYRVNAGFIPSTNWVHSPENGGRIIGEVCHFVDVCSYLTGALPVSVFARSVTNRNVEKQSDDNVSIQLQYGDGSLATIVYVANGSVSVPKEFLEVSSMGLTAQMDNFRSLKLFKGGKARRERFDGSKGHRQEVEHFLKMVAEGEEPAIKVDSMLATTIATILAKDSLNSGRPFEVDVHGS